MRAVSLTVLLSCCSFLSAFDPTTQPVSPDGTRATIDLPAARHIKNVGGSDGSGLCVFTSVQHSADWQNVRVLDGFREWMRKRPGGGWPQKLDQMFAQFCREKGVSVPPYIQHTGGDETFLELALKTDRMPAVTYDGRDDFYRGQIAHMVNLAYLDSKSAAIIDNNRPGYWVWMTRSEFLSRWRGNSGGWAVVLLGDPPPAAPEGVQAFGAAPCVCGDSCACAKGECPAKCPTVFGQCQNGSYRIAPAAPGLPAAPAQGASGPIGSPPSDRHYWGPFPDGRYGWLLRDDAPAVGAGPENYGVDPAKIHAAPTYSLNGTEVSKADAHRALVGADGLRDDSDRWHLTGVGDAAFQMRFRADVALLPVEVRNKLLVQTYGPTDWAVSLFRLPTGASLRKPSPARTAADVGSVPAAEYTAAKLTELLAKEGGPAYVPKPPAPVMPAPVPPGPAPAPEPKPEPQPAPAPQPKPDNTILYILAALAGLWLLSRKATP